MQKSVRQSIFFLASIIFLWGCRAPRKTEQAVKLPGVMDSGMLVLKNGDNLVIYQKFSIRGDSIHTQILSVSKKTTLAETGGLLSKQGTPDSLFFKTYVSTDSGTWQPAAEASVLISQDSIITRVGGKRHIIGSRSVNPDFEISFRDKLCYIPLPYAGFPSIKYSDSVAMLPIHIPLPAVLNIDSSGNIAINRPQQPRGRLTLYISREGRLDSIRGENEFSEISGKVYRNFNFDSIMLANVPRKKLPVKRRIAKTDSVIFNNDGLIVKVKYERPELQGRKIFGYKVPFNKVWVTGVDTAAEFYVNQPVSFYGQQLDTGKYSLLTIPRKDLWMLILNRETGLGLNNYNPDYDVFRVPMKVDSLTEKVKYLTINIMPFNKGGLLTIKWENTGAVVMFK